MLGVRFGRKLAVFGQFEALTSACRRSSGDMLGRQSEKVISRFQHFYPMDYKESRVVAKGRFRGQRAELSLDDARVLFTSHLHPV